jgi:hypothetical protein
MKIVKSLWTQANSSPSEAWEFHKASKKVSEMLSECKGYNIHTCLVKVSLAGAGRGAGFSGKTHSYHTTKIPIPYTGEEKEEKYSLALEFVEGLGLKDSLSELLLDECEDKLEKMFVK